QFVISLIYDPLLQNQGKLLCNQLNQTKLLLLFELLSPSRIFVLQKWSVSSVFHKNLKLLELIDDPHNNDILSLTVFFQRTNASFQYNPILPDRPFHF